MPIQVEEREAGQILYISFADVWDTAELKQAVKAIQNYLSHANHPIRLVVDVRSTYQFPLGALSYLPIRRPSLAATLVTECVFIGGTSVARSMAQAACKLCQVNRFAFVETEEQAWKRLGMDTQSEIRV